MVFFAWESVPSRMVICHLLAYPQIKRWLSARACLSGVLKEANGAICGCLSFVRSGHCWVYSPRDNWGEDYARVDSICSCLVVIYLSFNYHGNCFIRRTFVFPSTFLTRLFQMRFPGSLLKWLPISLSPVGGADGAHRGGLEGKQKLGLFWRGREPKFVYLTSPALGIRGWGREGGRLGRVAKSGMQLVPSPWGKAHFISECSHSANVLSTLLAARDVTHLRQNIFLLLQRDTEVEVFALFLH